MKSLLAIVAAPFMNANIVQAMTIQAHQPDVVILIRTKISGQSENIQNNTLLFDWIQGTEALSNSFGDLNEPYKFPYTPPNGYVPKRDGTIPDLIEINLDSHNLLTTLMQIENDFPNYQYTFDLLPGAKLSKFDLFLKDAKNWVKTYTLEDGVILKFQGGNLEYLDGEFLSIIDRCWLSGFPVHVSNDSESIRLCQDLYTMVMKSIYIEPFDQIEQELIDSRNKNLSNSEMRTRKNDRPISMKSGKFAKRFESLGGKVIHKDESGMKLEGPNGDIWDIDFYQNTVPNGVPLELLMVNEINKYWDMKELYHGVSIIHPTPELRVKSYMNLLKHQYKSFIEHPELEHMIGPFRDRCSVLGISLETPLEKILEMEFENLNGVEDEDSRLAYIRVCEIDALGLDSHGIVSFDAKQVLRSVNYLQASMQRPSFLFNPKGNNHYVIASTSPDPNLSQHSVIHLSNLKEGREILNSNEKGSWNPSEFDIELLRKDWIEAVAHLFQVQKNNQQFHSEWLTEEYFETRIGVSWQVICQILWNKHIPLLVAIEKYSISNENDKDNFIQLLTGGYSLMLENYQTINAEYDEKRQEIKDILKSHRKDVKKLKEELSIAKKKIRTLEDKLKSKKKGNVIPHEFLKSKLETVTDDGIDYKSFLISVNNEGYSTKGILKKINSVSKNVFGYEFELALIEKETILRPVKTGG